MSLVNDGVAVSTNDGSKVTTALAGVNQPSAATAVAAAESKVKPETALTHTTGHATHPMDGSKRELDRAEDVPASFPEKLMDILSTEEYQDVISWLPHGKGFIIRNKKRFADEILPKHFKQSKFTSFTRKLNRWSFTRVTRGPEVGSYFHPSFQKGNPKLTSQMTCISAKAAQQLQPLDPVALGVVQLGDNDGIQQWTHEQAQWHMYHQYYQQQQAFMAQMVAPGPSDNHDAASSPPVAIPPMPPFDPQQMAAMQTFYQQQQYYAQAMHQAPRPPMPLPIPTAASTAATHTVLPDAQSTEASEKPLDSEDFKETLESQPPSVPLEPMTTDQAVDPDATNHIEETMDAGTTEGKNDEFMEPAREPELGDASTGVDVSTIPNESAGTTDDANDTKEEFIM